MQELAEKVGSENISDIIDKKSLLHFINFIWFDWYNTCAMD